MTTESECESFAITEGLEFSSWKFGMPGFCLFGPYSSRDQVRWDKFNNSYNRILVCKELQTEQMALPSDIPSSQPTDFNFAAWDISFIHCIFGAYDVEKNTIHCSFEAPTGKSTKIRFTPILDVTTTCSDESKFGDEGSEEVLESTTTTTTVVKELHILSSITAEEKNSVSVTKTFCVQALVYDTVNGNDMVVNRSTQKIKLEMSYSLDGNFIVEKVEVEEKDTGEEITTDTGSVNIEGYHCDPSTGDKKSDVLNLGDTLTLCVESKSLGVKISNIKSLEFEYGVDNPYSAIADSSSNALTRIVCPWMNNICKIDTIVIADFVKGGNREIVASGVAGITYLRRKLNGGELESRLLAQSKKEEDVKFSVVIALAKPVSVNRLVLSKSTDMNHTIVFVAMLLGMLSLLV